MQIVALDQPQELAYLVRLRLSLDGLEVERLGYASVDEDVMAAAGPAQLETHPFGERAKVREGYIRNVAVAEALKQPTLVHVRNVGASWDARLRPSVSSAGETGALHSAGSRERLLLAYPANTRGSVTAAASSAGVRSVSAETRRTSIGLKLAAVTYPP